MNDNVEFDQLDALLAKSATLANRGFSERISRQLNRQRRTRRNLFLITGSCWFALMVLASSPQAIFRDLVSLIQSLDLGGIYTTAVNYSQLTTASPEQLPLATLAVVVLSAAALASLALRS